MVKSAKYPHAEAKLYHYVINTRKNRSAVSMKMLQFEGRRLARKHNISISEFKVNYGWVRRFMARHDITIRHRRMIAQRLPPEAYEGKLVSFQKYVLEPQKAARIPIRTWVLKLFRWRTTK
jgi:hypothetical protein